RPAAGCDDDAVAPPLRTRLADDAAEFARDVVVAALRENAFGDSETLQCVLVLAACLVREAFDLSPGGGRFADARAAEHHDGVRDAALLEQKLGLFVVESE